MKLHLGCGGVKLPDFTNVDVRPEVSPDQLVDLEALPWPWADGAVDEIQSFHVLEHLDKAGGAAFLGECARVLKVGGRLVLELPNVEETARELGEGNLERIHNLYGLQRNPFDHHRYGYTPVTLSMALEALGLSVVFVGQGTDYHAKQEPCMRLEATRI